QDLQSVAGSATASRRVKLEYANTLNNLSHAQPHEQAEATCQEALRILSGLVALDLSDLSASSAWADIADSAARDALWNGRMEQAERLERQVLKVAEGVLARAPGDWRARLGRWWAQDLLGLIEARRFHEPSALQLIQRSRDALEDYIRFNPTDLNGSIWLDGVDYTISSLLFRCGRITEALQRLRPAAQSERERRGSGAMLSVPFLGSLWSAPAIWEAQRGNRDIAEQDLQELRQSVEVVTNRELVPDRTKEGYLQLANDAERQARLAFGEDAVVLTNASGALSRLHKLRESET